MTHDVADNNKMTTTSFVLLFITLALLNSSSVSVTPFLTDTEKLKRAMLHTERKSVNITGISSPIIGGFSSSNCVSKIEYIVPKPQHRRLPPR